MTTSEIIKLLDEGELTIQRWNKYHYDVKLRPVKDSFCTDYLQISGLLQAGILDDEAAQKAKAALVEKYGTVEEQSILAANSHEKGGTVSNGAKIL